MKFEDPALIVPHAESAFRLWWGALLLFILAAGTGAFLRFGVFAGMGGLQYANVRHAHSHLMYFGWVTPALMSLIAAQLPAVSDRPLSNRFRWPIIMALIGGLLAYVPFLLYGYRPAIINGNQVPLSVMNSLPNRTPTGISQESDCQL